MTWKDKGYNRIVTEYINRNDRRTRGEHDIIFEKYNKCCLLKWGLVHHKNEIRNDNQIDNLQGMTRSQHMSYHNLRKPHKNTDYKSRICFECGTDKTSMNKKPSGYIYPKWYKVGIDEWLCRTCYKRKHEQAGLWKRYSGS